MYPDKKQQTIGSITILGESQFRHLSLLNLIDSCIAYVQYYIYYDVGATGTTTRCTGCKVDDVCHGVNTQWTKDCLTYQCKQLGSFWMYANIVSARK